MIGISGVTCGGKSSLAQSLREFLSAGKFSDSAWNGDPRVRELRHRMSHCRFRIGNVEVIHQDKYFLPEHCQQSVEQLNHKNWELITSLDMKQMRHDIESTLRKELTLQLPDGKVIHNVINVLILEGFIIFKDSFILELCNLRVHLHLPYEKCFARRKVRTYDPPDVVGYFEMCVWPEYEKYFRERVKDRKDILLLNGEVSKLELNLFVINMIGAVFKF